MSDHGPTTELARALLRASSPSGAEGPAAQVLLGAFHRLGFDRAWLDEAGNAIGVFERGEGPFVMLNGHLDTVPVGNEELWPYPPLAAEISGGRLWGRGASDMKSSLACMATAAAAAAEDDFSGTLMVAGVVQEEVGGLGSRWLAENMRPDVVVLGEPSKLSLKLGHRGRIEIDVHLPGRIAHAAKSELGENALYRAAQWLQALQGLELPSGGPLRASTATPTRLVSHPTEGANVVPGEAVVTVDYRNLPGDPPDEVLERLQGLDEGARLVVSEEHAVSENRAIERRFPRINSAYLAPSESRWVDVARETLAAVLPRHGRTFEEGTWWFATDAPYLAESGAVVIGFGPGEEELAHTTDESVSLEALEVATDAYRQLASALLGEA